ncbi:MAG: hypothetical protein PHT95_02960 [Candidatus Omnitrophica bacterium]|nr:hypothetical protein [Candidatus Omnitrophota bacterium]
MFFLFRPDSGGLGIAALSVYRSFMDKMSYGAYMDIKGRTRIAVLTAGAASMAAQIIFLREFLIVFYGNEISIGMILAGWLFWGAIGSLFLGRLADIVSDKTRLLYSALILLSGLIPLVLMGIRFAKPAMGILPGEIAGYYPMVLAALTLLCMPCVLLGFIFSAACRVYSSVPSEASRSVAGIYMMDSLGAIAGGLVASYILVPLMDSLGIALIFSALILSAAFILEKDDDRVFFGRSARVLTALAILIGTVFFLAGGYERIKTGSIKRLWSGFSVKASRDSVYGNVVVAERGGQVSLYGNGLHLYTVPDRLSAENAVHFTLLENTLPKKVLIVGGGAGGLLAEVMKHDVDRIDYIELDPLIIEMSRMYLPETYARALDDERVRIMNVDGRLYVKTTGEKYDCVIVALGDPFTAQINRFYTVEFFREAKRIMAPGAVLSFGLTSSENYIGEELADYLSSIFRSLNSVFADILLIPGDTMLFLASSEPGHLTSDVDILTDRMTERGIEAQYVNEYYLFDTLSPGRVEYARDAVAGRGGISLNTDLRPISYYFATVFWSTQFDTPALRRFFNTLDAGIIWGAAGSLIFLVSLFSLLKKNGKKRYAALLAIAGAGFAGIVFQICVILAFQAVYGYVFYKIGVIVTSFMAGLVIGSFEARKSMDKGAPDKRALKTLQALLAGTSLLLPAVFVLFSKAETVWVCAIGAELIFPLMPVIFGFIGGMIFPIANRIVLDSRNDVGRVSGASNGMDLIGACAGALLASSVFIPILGIFQTCLIAGAFNLALLMTGGSGDDIV